MNATHRLLPRCSPPMCEGRFSKHGHHMPGRSGTAESHPTRRFASVALNAAFGPDYRRSSLRRRAAGPDPERPFTGAVMQDLLGQTGPHYRNGDCARSSPNFRSRVRSPGLHHLPGSPQLISVHVRRCDAARNSTVRVRRRRGTRPRRGRNRRLPPTRSRAGPARSRSPAGPWMRVEVPAPSDPGPNGNARGTLDQRRALVGHQVEGIAHEMAVQHGNELQRRLFLIVRAPVAIPRAPTRRTCAGSMPRPSPTALRGEREHSQSFGLSESLGESAPPARDPARGVAT